MNAKQKLHQASLAKWASRFKEQASSGLTVKNWCTQNDISLHAYNYWKHIFKEECVDSLLPDIVPVSLPSSISTTEASFDMDASPCLPSATTRSSVSRESRSSYNSIGTRCLPSSDSDPSICITLGDVRIEIGASASDTLLLNLIQAVRHA